MQKNPNTGLRWASNSEFVVKSTQKNNCFMYMACRHSIYVLTTKILQIAEITGEKYEYFPLLKRNIHGILQQWNTRNEKRHHITPVWITINVTHLFSVNKPHELSCRFGTSGCTIHTNSIPNLVAGATARDLRPFLRQSCNKITNSNNKHSINSHIITESKTKTGTLTETQISKRPLRATVHGSEVM
jgi:hypothetical protein